MVRLIDADALKQYCDDNWVVINHDAIDAQPTVDAVPVIRCRECKHRPYRDDDGMIDGDYVCPYLCDDPYYSTVPKDDGFCHRAERREHETD